MDEKDGQERVRQGFNNVKFFRGWMNRDELGHLIILFRGWDFRLWEWAREIIFQAIREYQSKKHELEDKQKKGAEEKKKRVSEFSCWFLLEKSIHRYGCHVSLYLPHHHIYFPFSLLFFWVLFLWFGYGYLNICMSLIRIWVIYGF